MTPATCETLLNVLFGTDAAVPPECPTMSSATYEQVQELRRIQGQLTALQVEGATLREAWGLRIFEALKRKLRRLPPPEIEYRALQEQKREKERQMDGLVYSSEIVDANFLQYLPCGEGYVRIPTAFYASLSEYFFNEQPPVSLEPVRGRFNTIWEQFTGYSPDMRVLSFVAVISAGNSDFDMEDFTAWDARVAAMCYSEGTDLTHPNTYHRFLIHGLLYGLYEGTLEDRYIGLRIGWELFRERVGSLFQSSFRGLVAAAQLLRSIHPIPQEVDVFKTVYGEQLDRYHAFLRSLHHRAMHPDSRVESEAFRDMFDNQLFTYDAEGIGIPDEVLITAARLICLPVSNDEIFGRLNDVLQSDNLSLPVASILIDTPLYFKNRHGTPPDGVPSFDEQLRKRYAQAKQTPSPARFKPLHAALVVLQPGLVAHNMEVLRELAENLNYLPKSARCIVSLLLMEGAMPWVAHRRLIYPLWASEGFG